VLKAVEKELSNSLGFARLPIKLAVSIEHGRQTVYIGNSSLSYNNRHLGGLRAS
jgi:hypothetical protein